MHGTEAYEKFLETAKLPPAPDGYGLLLITDRGGQRHTLATADIEYLHLLHHGLLDHGPMNDVTFPPHKFHHVLEGWLEIPSPSA
ncbi:hypothetical protein [Streptomyces albidoflavus]|uniref:hypothetical protein n=1 Tax=Streptomyces albidoflavus TaxID=1886 RepID=UPI00225B9339|nr:hypothetical protein [Streptomyces albidoflavus]MCX4444761.1 hypothetical protein [Streptomyces albidoflavus]